MGEMITSESRNESLSATIRIEYGDLFLAFDPVKPLMERYEVSFSLSLRTERCSPEPRRIHLNSYITLSLKHSTTIWQYPWERTQGTI